MQDHQYLIACITCYWWPSANVTILHYFRDSATFALYVTDVSLRSHSILTMQSRL